VEAIQASSKLGDLQISVTYDTDGPMQTGLNGVPFVGYGVDTYTPDQRSEIPAYVLTNYTPSAQPQGATPPVGSDVVRLTALADHPYYYGDASANSLGTVLFGADGGDPMADAFSGAVRVADGAVSLSSTDLSTGTFGIPWGHTRTYTSELGFGENSLNGRGMVISQLPFLIEGTATVVAVMNGRSAFYFDRVGGTLKPRFFSPETLAHEGSLYVLTDTEGNQIKFHDFGDGLTINPLAGKFDSSRDASGTTIKATYAGKRVRVLTRTNADMNPAPATVINEEVLYTYLSPDSELIRSAILRRNGAAVESAFYDYYDSWDCNGLAGQLKEVNIIRSGSKVDRTVYTYYISGTAGERGLLRAVFGTRTLAVMEARDIDATEATDDESKGYADYWFSYDDQGRVKRQIIGGAGEYDYTYQDQGAYAFNSARSTTIEKFVTHDANTLVADRTYHANFAAEVIMEDVSDDVGRHWVTRSTFDIDGRVTSEAMPSAAAGGANGLVTHYDYDEDSHYLNRVAVTKGDSTVPTTDQSTSTFATIARYQYQAVNLGANKPVARLVSQSTVYPDGSTASITS
jgi:hypothetical protein